MAEALQRATRRLRDWICESAGEGEGGLGLNILWVYEGHLAGTRFDRPLWTRSRAAAVECDTCGQCHADPGEESYRFVEFASEKLTVGDDWQRVPDESVFWVDDDFQVQYEPMLEA